jgi:hypothetical protein
MMELNYRKCTVGRAMRNQAGYRQKHYIPTVMFGKFGVPLNTQFDTATKAILFAGRFARKWNAAEDIRMARKMGE